MANIKIYGTGEVPGGTYEDISVYGSAKATGDIIAELVSIKGSISVNGSIKTSDLSSSGACKVTGDLDAKIINSSGVLKIDGSCNANIMILRGNISIGGDLNVDSLNAKIASGTFKNIYGDNIFIKRSEWLGTNVQVDEIAATIINVQDIKANRLSGNNVYVYGNSNIDTVEYSGELTISKTSFVKNIIKL